MVPSRTKQRSELESWAGDRPATIGLLVAGVVALVIGVLFENWTDRSPIIPPRLFKVEYSLLSLAILVQSKKTDTYDGTDILHGFLPLLCILLRYVIFFSDDCLRSLIIFLAAYYLPLYFQILGASATRSGIL